MEVHRCFFCKKILNIYDRDTYPYKNTLDMNFYCFKCIEEKNIESCEAVSENTQHLFRKHNLKATCGCYENAVLAGYGLNQDNFEIECFSCRKNNSFNLQESSPFGIFVHKISRLKSEQFMPKEQVQILNKFNISDLEQIYKTIKLAESYILESPRCLTHFKNNYFIGENSFRYLCELCNPNENRVHLYDDQNIKILALKMFGKIKNMPTRFFTTCIIDYALGTSQNYSDFKNLVYDFGQIAPEIKDSDNYLTPESICLKCKENFSINNFPISTHGELKHEICSSCYYKKKVLYCPIDKLPISNATHRSSNFLFLKLDKTCCIENCVNKFSVVFNIIPYEAKCLHNICSNCLQNPIKRCSKCLKDINSEDCVENKTLKHLILFSELICKEHNKVAQNFYDNASAIEPRCFKCVKRLPQIELENGIKIINQSLVQIINNMPGKDKLDDFIILNIEFIPLSIKYNYIENAKNNQPNIICAFRFCGILPKYNASELYWYDRGSLNTFSFTSHIIGAIVGVFIGINVSLGNPLDVDFKLSDGDGKVCTGKPEIIPNENRYLRYIFKQRILISEKGLFFKVHFGKGRYYQGEGEIGVNHNSFGFNGDDCFFLQFTTFKSGNMNSGGPLLGFLIEGIYVPTKFLPDYMEKII